MADDGLKIESIEFRNFRNYESLSIDGLNNLVIFVGPNAVGKTNIIEGVQLISALKSFRTSHVSQMVHWESNAASIEAHLVGDGRDLIEHLDIDNGKKTYLLNGKKRSIQSMKGLFPAVVFCPDDLELAKGADSERRNALDDLGCQLSKNFYAVRNDYTKLVKQKNRALKDERSDAYIDSIDEILIKVGVQLLAHRLFIVGKFDEVFNDYYQSITGSHERADLIYKPWFYDNDDISYMFDKEEATSSFKKSLEKNRSYERKRFLSCVGPHKDVIRFILDGKDAVDFASQGQQRSLVLAAKLSEASILQDILGQKPILLLDDVMSELDDSRRQSFMSFISDDIQTFITTAHIDYFDDEVKAKAQIIELPFQSEKR